MSAPNTVEAELLGPAESIISAFTRRYCGIEFEARLQLLEAAASRTGGFWLEAFHAEFGITPIAPAAELLIIGKELISELRKTPIHPTLALSALAREKLSEASQKSTGAYHTDFRLATRVAQLAASRLRPSGRVIDPSCGAGILLAALAIEYCGPDRRKVTRWLAESVYATDLSAVSLRSALLVLGSLTSDLGALAAMRARWKQCDSLLLSDREWRELAPQGFDVVVGNPPWEKLKVTKHEFLKESGTDRHYGAEVNGIDTAGFQKRKSGMDGYVRELTRKYSCLGNGEPDLYIAFTELFQTLCRPNGLLVALLPAGLIRSQGTEPLRRKLIDESERISFSIIENRARFFSIDTRFKFLAVSCNKAAIATGARATITITHERGTPTHLEKIGTVRMARMALSSVRPDLSIPEVRHAREWAIFRKLSAKGTSWNDPDWGWTPSFCREADMTRERPHFIAPESARGQLPVIEGRMVQQFRCGAKAYVEGSGRKAVWRRLPVGCSSIAPQFYIDRKVLSRSVLDRVDILRGGFCDITGQTNERSMMAALIPPGVVCGNKVPTILFPADPSEERLLVWAAIMNSFVFDWLLRRIITTTVNYFLLLSVPMPKLVRDGLPWRRLANASRELRRIDSAGNTPISPARAAELRAEIDAEVALAYGISVSDFACILGDFPLLDRGQPALENESHSTITRDKALAATATRLQKSASEWAARVHRAERRGAMAYVASEFATSDMAVEKDAANDD